MRAFIITVVILMAFIAAGNALVCEVCFNRTISTCTGEVETCDPDVTACENSVAEIQFGESTNLQVFKGCSKTPCNHLYYSESVKGVKARIKRLCCESNGCNNGNVTLSPRNYTLNGRQCPACYKEGTFECSDIQMLDCEGDETGCLTFEGLVDLTGGDSIKTVAKGCVNFEHCDPSPQIPGNFLPENHNMTCTKANLTTSD